ncbi:MAG: hypothetical protein R6W82_05580 [bacterium]
MSPLTRILAAAGLAAALLLPAPDTQAQRSPERVRLLFTANGLGYIDPCDCSSGLLGGLDHRAAAIRRLREEGLPTLLLDLGNLFEIPAGPMTELGRRQAAFLEGELDSLGYQLVALGPNDLQMHPEELQGCLPGGAAPFLLTNAGEGVLPGEGPVPVRRFRLGDVEAAFLAVVEEGAAEKLVPWEEALAGALEEVSDADLRVVIAHLGFETVQGLPERFPLADVVLDAARLIPRQAMRYRGALLMSAAGKGQQLAVLDLTVDPSPGRRGRGVTAFQGRHILLEPESPADPDVKARMGAFRARLVRDGLILP